MDNYVRDITGAFRENNRVRPKRLAALISNDYKVITEAPDSSGKIIAKNKTPGLYLVILNKKAYLINLVDALTGNDQLVIESKYKTYTIIDGVTRFIIPYRLITPDFRDSTMLLDYSVNSIADAVCVSGKTTLSGDPTPSKPVTMTSIGSFKITSTGDNSNQKYELNIDLKNNIKSLPNGVNDLFVMDSLTQEAYIIYKVGRVILTGAEEWYTVEENANYCIYSMVLASVNIGEDDRSVNCNYFPTITCSNMLNDKNKTYAISNNNDKDYPGFYIRIPTKLIKEPGVDNFKEFIRNALKTNPITIEYLLKSNIYRQVLMDEYCVQLFYPNTHVTINVNSRVGIFYKAMNYDQETEYKRGVLQFIV